MWVWDCATAKTLMCRHAAAVGWDRQAHFWPATSQFCCLTGGTGLLQRRSNTSVLLQGPASSSQLRISSQRTMDEWVLLEKPAEDGKPAEPTEGEEPPAHAPAAPVTPQVGWTWLWHAFPVLGLSKHGAEVRMGWAPPRRHRRSALVPPVAGQRQLDCLLAPSPLSPPGAVEAERMLLVCLVALA